MCAWHRHAWWLATLFVLVVTRPAQAWVETAIRTDVVTVDLERDGSAVVRHELSVRVRGGPLQAIELDGVDADATPLPDSTVVNAESGGAPTPPVPLLLERQGNVLRLEIDHDKGLARGAYLFRFAYRTQLLNRDLIRLDGRRAEVRWVGPRFPDGIDSAKVVFRVPTASEPPEPARATDHTADDTTGVFLSTLRRASDKDELELVRPHVAKGEPAVWRIRVAPSALDAFSAPPDPSLTAAPDAGILSAERRALLLGSLFGLALLYAGLVLAKWRGLEKLAALRDVTPLPWVPLPIALRAALAGLALAGAGALAFISEESVIAATLLLVAILLAAHRTPLAKPRPRGPGRWQALSDELAFRGARLRLPGAWLDATRWPGFALFAGSLTAAGAGAFQLLGERPFDALLAGLGATAILPLFLTGRIGELPLDPVEAPRRLLAKLARRLRRTPGLEVNAWARIPDGASEPDELRLLVMPEPAVSGLNAIEVGLEYEFGTGGSLAMPCVLVRTTEGSLAHARLDRHVRFTRGKQPEERVALLRPKLPTFEHLAPLVERLVRSLREERADLRRSRAPLPKVRQDAPASRPAAPAKPATSHPAPGRSMPRPRAFNVSRPAS
jgi:hypothetical protein